MDRNVVLNILDQADFFMPEVSTAARMLAAVTHTHTPPHLGMHATIPTSDDTITLIDPADITWPRDLYAGMLLAADTENRQAISDFAHAVNGLPQRRQRAQAAAPRFLTRLLNGTDPAAEAEAQRLHDDLIALRITGTYDRYLNARALFTAAVNLQDTTGVHLDTTNPAIPPEFVTQTQQLIRDSIGNPDAIIQPIAAAELALARDAVTAWKRDPHSTLNLRNQAETTLRTLTEQRVTVLLEQMPVEALKAATNQRLRTTGLDTAGITTVADVISTPHSTLTAINGIGEATARRLKAAAQALSNEARSTHSTRIGTDPTDTAIALVRILNIYGQIALDDEQARARIDRLSALGQALPTNPLAHATHADNWLALANQNTTIEQLRDDIRWLSVSPDLFGTATIVDPGADVWEDYLQQPARYQALLADLLRIDADNTGFTDADTIAAIRNLTLNTEHLTEGTFLRGYQSFGAKFATIRKKTVLGDEMGLGKTIQAIAWAAHLAATDPEAQHILVICPASVVLNWMRELKKFSTLPAHMGHGENKHTALNSWKNDGGFLVVTYEGAKTLNLTDADTVIVDEAHMIKNPRSGRSKAASTLIANAPYAMLLTGTPLENRVSEFVTLINYVQPELITKGMGSLNAGDFARHIAPAYLRRNQTDVLDELPEKLEEDDIIELNDDDHAIYATAVENGGWMTMRRAAFLNQHTTPAKIERILDIVNDAENADRKVIIFTYFLDVIDALEHHLGDRVIGTITGQVPAATRQNYVDQLSTAAAGSVLIAQITAGGTGLNIQAASVVILAEPQIKPSIEDQAIARAFRMGQTRKVHVHRLIGADTVDERMLDILAPKRQAFDAYARHSDITASVPDAVDITEAQLAATIIAAERQRLGFDPTAPTQTTDTPAPQGIQALSDSDEPTQ
ncbi:SNF2-related protein [Corynebacterium aquilae]|uniref:SNF2-related protein n=1 Tax=Corynebacterium aquilae TaxID=203263 RepID=UPI00095149FA|nr:SNF2-related protein [Corynebacterium aquilae]